MDDVEYFTSGWTKDWWVSLRSAFPTERDALELNRNESSLGFNSHAENRGIDSQGTAIPVGDLTRLVDVVVV